jgi:photosystem II stability/assembly factor-like uncharacterized protein
MTTKHFSAAILLLMAHFFNLNAQSTWQYLPNSPGTVTLGEGRIDDVFFLNANEGWCASGGGNIYHTTDGGGTWTNQLDAGNNIYFRSIEFRNSQLGFAGSLNKRFYRTTNGGQTWTNIANQIAPIPDAICGISIPTDSVVYAVGQWNEPAFYLKSTDGGQSFTSQSMSTLARGLVDVLFTSRDTGWVSGKGIGGATILRTTDGGATWTQLFNSGINGEYVWKLQRVTPQVWVGSIQTMASPNGRMVKSTDGGITWVTLSAPITDMQGIGFATPEKGWIGDYSPGFYETNDGGLTWTQQFFGASFNRFYFLDSTTAFASGSAVYKFAPMGSSSAEAPPPFTPEKFEFTITPNPTSGKTQVQFELKQTDNVRISVLSSAGVELRNLYRERLPEGKHTVDVDTGDLPNGNYLLWIQRNHGLHTKPLIITH